MAATLRVSCPLQASQGDGGLQRLSVSLSALFSLMSPQTVTFGYS